MGAFFPPLKLNCSKQAGINTLQQTSPELIPSPQLTKQNPSTIGNKPKLHGFFINCLIK
jgi:hypothetical protein